MIKPGKKDSVVFFTNPSFKRPKKYISAIMALVFLLTVCQPLEARPGNYGEYSSGEMFGMGMLVGAITDIMILLSCGTGGVPGGIAAGAGAVASQLTGLYMYYNEYETSGETIFEMDLFGTEVKISRGAFWSMVAGVVVGCAAGWAAGGVATTKEVVKEIVVNGIVVTITETVTLTVVEIVTNCILELVTKLTIGFLIMCIQKWCEEYLVQKHGVKRLWAQTAGSIAGLAVNFLGVLLVKKVANAKISKDGKTLTTNDGIDKNGNPIKPEEFKVESTYAEGPGKGKPEIVSNANGSFKTQIDASGNVTGLKSTGTGTTIATIILDIVSVATGNGITALVQKTVGGVFKLFGINKVFTGYGQVKDEKEADAKTKVFKDTAEAVTEVKEKLNSPESTEQVRSDLLFEAEKAKISNPELAAKMMELANKTGQIDIKQAAALIDQANAGLGVKLGLVGPGNPLLEKLGLSTGSNYLDNKILAEALKNDPGLTGRMQSLSLWLQVTGGIPEYQFMPLHEAILGEVLNRGYATALKQVARAGILGLLDYRKYHGRNKEKNYANLVKMIIAESGANLITGTVHGYTSDNLNTNSFLNLALKETGSGLAQIGLARWTRDWDLLPALKAVVQLAGASVAGAAIDAAFRRGEGEDSKLTAGSFARGAAENFNKYFAKTAMDVALMPPILTVSGVDSAIAQNGYEEYQNRLIGYYNSMAEANYGGRTVDFTSVFMNDVSQKMSQNAGVDLGGSFADSGARLLNKMGTDILTQDVSFKSWVPVSAEQTARLKEEREALRKDLEKINTKKDESGLIVKESIRSGRGPITLKDRNDKPSAEDKDAAIQSLKARIGALDTQISTRENAEKLVTYLGAVPVIGAFAMGAAGGAEGYAERGYGVLSDVFKGGAEYTARTTEGELSGINKKIADLEKSGKQDKYLILLKYKKAELEAAIKKGESTETRFSEVAGIAQPIEVRNSKGGLVERTTVDNFSRPIRTDYYNGQGRKEDKVTDYYGPHSGDFSITTDYTKIDPGAWKTRDVQQQVSAERKVVTTETKRETHYQTIDNIGFNDSKVPAEKEKEVIDYIKESLKPKAPEEKIKLVGEVIVAGSTDGWDTAKYNKGLSGNRANSGAELVKAAGVNEKDIVTLSFGEDFSEQRPRRLPNPEEKSYDAPYRAVDIAYTTEKTTQKTTLIPAEYQTIAVDKPQSFDANVTYKFGDAYTGTPGLSVEASRIGSGPQLVTAGGQPNLSALYESTVKVNGMPVSYSSTREEIMEKTLQQVSVTPPVEIKTTPPAIPNPPPMLPMEPKTETKIDSAGSTGTTNVDVKPALKESEIRFPNELIQLGEEMIFEVPVDKNGLVKLMGKPMSLLDLKVSIEDINKDGVINNEDIEKDIDKFPAKPAAAQYTISQIAGAYNKYFKKQENGAQIDYNLAESALMQQLIDRGLVEFNSDDGIVVKQDAALMFMPEDTTQDTHQHEFIHAKFAIDPTYRQQVMDVWNGLPQAERDRFIGVMQQVGYETKDNPDNLIETEFAAYGTVPGGALSNFSSESARTKLQQIDPRKKAQAQ